MLDDKVIDLFRVPPGKKVKLRRRQLTGEG
jgi:hypothetical protein